MSLLRQRATDVSVLSTRSDRRPADARLRFVSAMSSRSDAELKVPVAHAATLLWFARMANDDRTPTRASRAGLRRGLEDMRSVVPRRGGFQWGPQRRRRVRSGPSREGPSAATRGTGGSGVVRCGRGGSGSVDAVLAG